GGAGDAAAAAAAAASGDSARVVVVGQWVPTLEAGLNIAQSSYTSNWRGGEQGSIVWVFLVNGTLENQIHPKVDWLNTLKLSYGQTHQQVRAGDDRSRDWDKPEKSTDLIDFESIARFTLGGFVDPFLSGRIESQFQDVSDPAGRTLAFTPIRFQESAGITRRFIDQKDRLVQSRLGFTFRQNSRRTFIEPPPSTKTSTEGTNDGGLEWVNDAKMNIVGDRISWTSKFSAFLPVFYSGRDDLKNLRGLDLSVVGLPDDIEDYPMAVDLDWENVFTSQITKVLSVNLYTRWLYDKYDNSVKPIPLAGYGLSNPDDVRRAVRKAGQFKQTLAIGLTYRIL
ncbi:MAG: DUF3078 domain-containing protein, partial [Candidatus Eisenbacteria bacterium]|nr:DUF3078 domain-containing protein [Candidatus Eisenbacteria bacterium]